MKKYLLISLITILFFGCSYNQSRKIIVAAGSGDPKEALKQVAKDRVKEYAQNPNLIKSDIKSLENIAEAFSNLKKAASDVWGEKEAKEPTPKEYVKYLDDYKSRAIIDYEKGLVSIGTLKEGEAKETLKRAIVMTLLMPHDPSGADLFNANDVVLGGEPYLYNEVLDNEQQPIRWEWRANKFADYLIENELKTYNLENGKSAIYVQIPMQQKHENVRAAKYGDIVKVYAKKYNVSERLVLAIIKTESDFNQYAISRSGAVGLMQIMPNTAGADAYKEIYKKDGKPTREYLFDPKNNIEMGTVYIDILKNRYLKDVKNGTSKEYCVISAYNGGAGTVLKTFHSDRSKAFTEINKKTPQEIYNILTTKVSSEETKNYLVKVEKHKKLF